MMDPYSSPIPNSTISASTRLQAQSAHSVFYQRSVTVTNYRRLSDKIQNSKNVSATCSVNLTQLPPPLRCSRFRLHPAIDGAFDSVMADHSIDDFINFDLDQIDIYEFLNSDPPLITQPSNQQEVHEDAIGDTIDPMDDPFVQSLFGTWSNEDASGSETKDMNKGQDDRSFPVSEEFEFWSVPAAPTSCSFCQVLREIVHTNGIYSTKLEIHGRVGMICHAILVTQISSGELTHQMLNLSKKSIEGVKEFLVQYCRSKKQAGFVLVSDPMAPFYEALCVGLDLSDNFGYSDDEADPPPGHGCGATNNHQAYGEAANQTSSSLPRSGPTRKSHQAALKAANQTSSSDTRTWYQKQRDRAANLTVEEVSGYFHLTLTKAAKQLGISATFVKKFCRRHRMPRWPYRKIKCNESRISELREVLQRTIYVNQQRQIEAEIARLQRGVEEIYIRFRAS